jgi:hypothetical protein
MWAHWMTQENNRISREAIGRAFGVIIRSIRAREALSRFKQNSSYFMYRTPKGKWVNF